MNSIELAAAKQALDITIPQLEDTKEWLTRHGDAHAGQLAVWLDEAAAIEESLVRLRSLRNLVSEVEKDASKTEDAVTTGTWVASQNEIVGARQRPRYVIGTDTPPLSPHTPARLYREGPSAGEYVLAASGSIEQMRALAKDLMGDRA